MLNKENTLINLEGLYDRCCTYCPRRDAWSTIAFKSRISATRRFGIWKIIGRIIQCPTAVPFVRALVLMKCSYAVHEEHNNTNWSNIYIWGRNERISGKPEITWRKNVFLFTVPPRLSLASSTKDFFEEVNNILNLQCVENANRLSTNVSTKSRILLPSFQKRLY